MSDVKQEILANAKVCTLWAIKTRHVYFCDNSGKFRPIFVFFSLLYSIYNNELPNKNLLKFSPHLKSVAALPCET